MNNKWLGFNYYKDELGRFDPIVDSLSDCIVQSAYLIGKNKFNISDFYVLFLNETTVKIVASNDKIISLGTIENVYDKNFFDVFVLSENGKNSSAIISERLKNGKISIVYPIIERFPFEELYDPQYKAMKRRAEHVFLIVGEDEENYYFVDNPAVIVTEKFSPFEGNPQVGLLNKKFFDSVTSDFCEILSPHFYLQKFEDVKAKWKDAVYLSYNNYFKQCVIEGNHTTYYGQEALKRLVELFESDKMNFSQEAPSHDRDLITYFRWRIWHIKGRRFLQKYTLKYFDQEESENKDRLIKALEGSWIYWDLLNKNMYKDFLNKKQIAGKKYVPLINKIIDKENNMNLAYKQFLNII